jgi:ribonuclease P protein component
VEVFLKKIKSKNEFEKIYTFGKAILSSDKKIKANYIFISRRTQPQLKYAVAVSSKSGNSVWRNRFKRLIRESVRSEKELIRKIVFLGEDNLSIIFTTGRLNQANHGKISLHDVQPPVKEILMSFKVN